MTRATIRGGGILPILRSMEGHEPRTLLLKNAETHMWEPPKGCANRQESTLASAIRELNEETSASWRVGLENIRSPYRLRYELNSNVAKDLMLFPVFFDRLPGGLRPSREHLEMRIVTLDEATSLQHTAERRALYRSLRQNILRELEDARIRSAATDRLVHALNEVRLDWPGEDDWFLHGSWASGEQTDASGSHSDVDLIRMSDHTDARRSRNAYTQATTSLKAALGKSVPCGVFHLRRGGGPLPRASQWTYFAARNIPIGGAIPSAVQIDSQPQRSSAESELMRLVWYKLVRTEFDDRGDDYVFLKGLITAHHHFTLDPTIDEFVGYARLAQRLTIRLLNARGHQEESLIEAWEAIDQKIGRLPLPTNGQTRERFSAFLRGVFERHKGEFCRAAEIFSSVCLAMIEHRSIADDHELVQGLLELCDLTMGSFNEAARFGEERTLVVGALMLSRLNLGGSYLINSVPKYERLAAQLTETLDESGADVAAWELNARIRSTLRRIQLSAEQWLPNLCSCGP